MAWRTQAPGRGIRQGRGAPRDRHFPLALKANAIGRAGHKSKQRYVAELSGTFWLGARRGARGPASPTRSTGVALFQGSWALQQLWLFWLAPIVGAVLGALLYRVLGDEDAA